MRNVFEGVLFVNKLIQAVAVAGFALFAADAALATPGLNLTVWNNAPQYNYYPDSTTIDQEKAYAASTTADSQSVVDVDPYGFYYNMNPAIYDFTGWLNVATAGTYTFQIAADDAARLSIDGVDLAESNFYDGNLNLPSTVDLNLTAGAHAFDLFAFQTVGGEYLYSYIYGNNGLTFTTDVAVPEPAMLGLFGLGAIGLGLSRRRKAA